MSDMPELDFKSKLGKFPVWVWGVAIGAVALVGYLLMRGRSGSNPVAQPNIDGTVGYQTSGMPGATSTSGGTPKVEVTDNNQTWLARVSRQVANSLNKAPTEVIAAMQKWLTGQDITSAEKAIIDAAVNIGFMPPQGTSGTSNVVDKLVPIEPPPTVTPPPVVVPPPVAAPKFLGYIRNTVGSIAATFDNGTKKEFYKFEDYAADAKATGKTWNDVSDGYYESFNTTSVKPGV